ncbi:cilia- and flagella-associated protein 126 [Caerostris darwini]|uniref:Cilia- and flagella-associated protein 126 n=1 Tax=Caerostris darwini TaxID=1538125 RepID=A0AAV4P7D0_9ARAC|nr:cilia- and flagella-associated protein 126 [Caerostris darwini]
MSLNFSAEQYESVYEPKHLSQWEVPKKFREHPRRHEGYTFPITDENGRFYDDATKPVFKEWSSFQGTFGKDYSQPKPVKCTPLKPGMWVIKGRKARWVDAIKIDSDHCFKTSD